MIIAYASANNNPLVSQADYTVNQTDLPAGKVFYGAGVDTENPTATFSYAWTLLAKPDNSIANLANATTSQVSFNQADTWGNYRLFLIVTNTATGETSEADPILAPKSAFVTFRVTSEHLEMEKPAKGERDWFNIAHKWVEELESIGGAIGDAQGLPVEAGGTTDVITLAGNKSYNINGTEGEINVSAIASPTAFDISIGLASPLSLQGSLTINDETNCNGDLNINPANTLFVSNIRGGVAPFGSLTYNGTTFSINRLNQAGASSEILIRSDIPTTSERAGVILEDNNGNPNAKILTYETTIYSRAVDHTYHFASGNNNPTVIDGISVYLSTDVNSHMIVFMKNTTSGKLYVRVEGTMQTGGRIGNGSEYVMNVMMAENDADFFSNTLILADTTDITRNANGGSLIISGTKDVALEAGEYLGLRVEAMPQYIGHGLCIDFKAKREIGV